MPVISALGRWRQEEQQLKVMFGYIAGSELAWATRDPVFKERSVCVWGGVEL